MISGRLPDRLRTTLSVKDRRRLRRLVAVSALALATMLIVWTLTPRTDGTPVVVTTGAISPGASITAGDLASRTFPAELVPDGAVTSPEEAIGKAAASRFTAGTPVTEAGLVTPRDQPLADGQLLMPVAVTDEAAASTLQAGHQVRVFAAGGAPGDDPAADLPGAAGQTATSGAVVDRAVVAAVSREPGSAMGGSTTVVTLIVTEQQASALAAVAGTALSFAMLN